MKRTEKILKSWKYWKKRVSLILACIVVFVTVYAMVLPAITLERDAVHEQDGIVLDTENSGEETAPDFTEELDANIPDQVQWPVILQWPEEISEAEETEAIQSVQDGYDEDEETDYSVTATFYEDAGLPADARLQVTEIERDTEEYEKYCERALDAVSREGSDEVLLRYARFFDITFLVDGEEVEPTGPVSIAIEYEDETELKKTEDEEVLNVVHFDREDIEEPQLMDIATEEENDQVTSISFESYAFSVYGVVTTCTAVSNYSVDGKTYQFSMPEGGSLCFSDLVEVLGAAEGREPEENAAEADENDTAPLTLEDVEVSDTTKKFVADVETMEFSSPGLLDVSRADTDTSVGQIKEDRTLECQYNAELAEDQIEKVNAQAVNAGDWTLISLQPFTTEETLTVTMKNGEEFDIKVRDAQISTKVLTADGETFDITVTYGPEAEIPKGAKLEAEELHENSDSYNDYLQKTQDVLSENGFNEMHSIRLFDIRILVDGREYEPKAPVQTAIKYDTPVFIAESRMKNGQRSIHCRTSAA